VVQAIQNSCDIFFYNVAGPAGKDSITGAELRYYEAGNFTAPLKFRGIGITPLNKYMEMFGVGAKTNIELPNEFKGVLPGSEWPTSTKKQGWSLGDTMVTSIGQGDTLMTPLQVANMTLAIATGKLFQPKIVRNVTNVDPDGKEVPIEKYQKFEPTIIRNIEVDAVNLQAIREGMSLVTSVHGTADKLSTDLGKLKVAGKTGTAEYGVAYDFTDTNEPIYPTHAWFTSYAPYENPEYVVTAVIQAEPGSQQIEGSTFAVPVVKQIYQTIYGKDTRFFPPAPTPIPPTVKPTSKK
jgi:penicillin-binding protein 2